METHSDKRFWLKNYICNANVTIGTRNSVLSDSDHFASKCSCSGKLIRIKDKVSALSQSGSTVYHVSDNDVYVPAVFTVKALEEACHQAEDILSQGSDDISHSVVVIQHFVLEFVPDTAFEKSFFRLVIFKFKMYNRDGEFRSKITPDNSMCEPEIRRRAGALWHENRESQSLADSSSHMSSAALTELLANLTSQPTLSSQLEEEPIALEHQASQLPLPNNKVMGAIKGHSYPKLGTFCAEEIVVSDRDADVLDSYPEWQKGYKPASNESQEQSISSDQPKKQNCGQKLSESGGSIGDKDSCESRQAVVGLTPDNLFASSSKESEELMKDQSADKQSARMDCPEKDDQKSVQGSDNTSLQSSARKSLGCKLPVKSQNFLKRRALIRGGGSIGESDVNTKVSVSSIDCSQTTSKSLTSKSPLKSKTSLARQALIRGSENPETDGTQSKSGSLGSSPSAKTLSDVLNDLSSRRSPEKQVSTKTSGEKQNKQNDGAKELSDDVIVIGEVIERASAEKTTRLSGMGERNVRSPRKTVGDMKVTEDSQGLLETELSSNKKSKLPQKIGLSTERNAAGSASTDKRNNDQHSSVLCEDSSERHRGDSAMNAAKKSGDGHSEGFIVISSESPEKSTEEMLDKHDKACQPEPPNAPILQSQCCQVGESLLFMTQDQDPGLRNAEIQVGASLAMESQQLSQEDNSNANRNPKPNVATNDKDKETPTSSSNKTSSISKFGARTRDFMEALGNSTIFSTPRLRPAAPSKDNDQELSSKDLSNDSHDAYNTANSGKSNSDKSNAASDFQNGQRMDSSDELVPASGEDRPRMGNEIGGTQVPFDTYSQKEVDDGQEKIELSCSDLSSPKDLHYSGNSESSHRSKSSGRLSGVTEKEFMGATKSQLDVCESQVPRTQVMHSTQKDDLVSQQRKRLSFPLSPVGHMQVSQMRGQFLPGFSQISAVNTQESAEKDKDRARQAEEGEIQKDDGSVSREDNTKSSDGTSQTNQTSSVSSKTDGSSSDAVHVKRISESEELISSCGNSGQITSSSGQITSAGDHVDDSEVQANEKVLPWKIPVGAEEKNDQNEMLELRLEVDELQSNETEQMHKTPIKLKSNLDVSGTNTPQQKGAENMKTPSSKTSISAKNIQTPVAAKSGVPQGGTVSPMDAVVTPSIARTPGVVATDQPCNSTPRDAEGARRRIPVVSPVEGTQDKSCVSESQDIESQDIESQDVATQQQSEVDNTKKSSPSTAVDIGKRYLEMMKNKDTTLSRKVDKISKRPKQKKLRSLKAKDAKSVIISELYGDQAEIQTTVTALFNAAPPLKKKNKKVGLSSKDTNLPKTGSITPKKPRMGLLQKNGLMLLPEHIEQEKLSQEQSVLDEINENYPNLSQHNKSSEESTQQMKPATKGRKKKVIDEDDTDDDDMDKIYKPPGTSAKKKKKKDQTPSKKLKVKQQLKGLTPKAIRRLTLDTEDVFQPQEASPDSGPSQPQDASQESGRLSPMNCLPSQLSGNSPEDTQSIVELLDILNEDLTPLQKSLQGYRIPGALTSTLMNDFIQGNFMELSH